MTQEQIQIQTLIQQVNDLKNKLLLVTNLQAGTSPMPPSTPMISQESAFRAGFQQGFISYRQQAKNLLQEQAKKSG